MKVRDSKGRFSPTVVGQKNRVHVRLTDRCYDYLTGQAKVSGVPLSAHVESLIMKEVESDSDSDTKPLVLSNLLTGAILGFSVSLLSVVIVLTFFV